MLCASLPVFSRSRIADTVAQVAKADYEKTGKKPAAAAEDDDE